MEEDGREDKATIKCETSPPPTPRAIRMTHTLPSSYHNDARRYDSQHTAGSMLPFRKYPSSFQCCQIDCLKIYTKNLISARILCWGIVLLSLPNIICEKNQNFHSENIFSFKINCIFAILLLASVDKKSSSIFGLYFLLK